VQDVHQADAGQHNQERGKLYLRRWRVYEFTYVVDNKSDHAIEHFYLEVPRPFARAAMLLRSSATSESEIGANRREQHSKRSSELIETAEPDQRLSHLYRFKLVAPTGLVKFIVKYGAAPVAPSLYPHTIT
jgi:hypothetical protein